MRQLLFTDLTACSLLLPHVADAAGKRKVIIDDDGFSMMHVMLLRAPDVEVVGITSVSGDLWATRAAATALRGLELLGRSDVPVAVGAYIAAPRPAKTRDTSASAKLGAIAVARLVTEGRTS